MRCPIAAEPLARACQHLAHVRDRRRDRGELLERGAGRLARRSGRASSCRCRAARRGSPSRRGPPRSRAAAPSPRRAPAPGRRTRRASAAAAAAPAARPLHALLRGVGEEVAHRGKYAPRRGDDHRAAGPPAERRLSLRLGRWSARLGFYRELLGIPLEGDGDWQEASLGRTRFALHPAHEGIGPLSSGVGPRELGSRDLDAGHGAPARRPGVEMEETMRRLGRAAARITDPGRLRGLPLRSRLARGGVTLRDEVDRSSCRS